MAMPNPGAGAASAPPAAAAPVPTTPSVPGTPAAAPAATPTVSPAPTPAQAAPPPKPQTLQDVLAARKLALNPEAYRAATGQPQTPAPTGETPVPPEGTGQPQTPGEAPQNNPGELTPEQAMFQLYKQDPATLMRVLEAATGKPASAPAPAPQAPQYLPPTEFQRQQIEAAQAQYAERPNINLQGLLGADALQELGVANTDFTATLEQFVHATMAPIFAQLLSDMYAANHGIHTQLQQFQPVLQSHKQTDLQRSLGKQLHEAFPALASGDTNARSYAERRFNELAPVLMSKELMENPHTNPEEYARITTGIAKIAAGEYANLTPAPASPAQSQIPPATVPPEPQPITPVYRNHIGQFAARQTPRTLEEWNAQRLAQLSLRQ